MKSIDNYADLFLNDVPMIDVRAPVEFEKGSFPTAVNLPLLTNTERQQIGTTYKKEGQAAAIALGHQLVSGDIKAERIEKWRAFAKENPKGCLFCFRGGLRSHITQEWLEETKMPYPLVTGGYKAMRRFLIETLEHVIAEGKFVIISGRTGTGKTSVLRQLPRAVDMEEMANHRGSSFGRMITPQPNQIDFENRLAIRLLKLAHGSGGTMFMEDESRLIGRCALPPKLIERMKNWPIAIVEDALESRISNVQRDYVTHLLAEYKETYGTEGFEKYTEFLKASLDRIRKRLGGARHKEISALLDNALRFHQLTGDDSLHRTWIYELLVHYYDPMYDYQLSKKENPVAVKGDRDAVLAWCEQK